MIIENTRTIIGEGILIDICMEVHNEYKNKKPLPRDEMIDAFEDRINHYCDNGLGGGYESSPSNRKIWSEIYDCVLDGSLDYQIDDEKERLELYGV